MSNENELINELQNIKNDRNINLKPENLRKGITCLGVTGTLEEGENISDYISETFEEDSSSTIKRGMSTLIKKINTVDINNKEDLSYFFSGCINLTSIASITNTSSATKMIYMFEKCRSLTSIPNLDTSSVTSMSYMFSGCNNLVTIPQLNMGSLIRIIFI